MYFLQRYNFYRFIKSRSTICNYRIKFWSAIYQTYNLNILATVRDGAISMMPPSSYSFTELDHLMVLGLQSDVERLE